MPVPYPKNTKERHAQQLRILLEKLQRFQSQVTLQSKLNGELFIQIEGAKLSHGFTDLQLVTTIVRTALSQLKPQSYLAPKLLDKLEQFDRMFKFAPTGGYPLVAQARLNGDVRIYMDFAGEYVFPNQSLVDTIVATAVRETKAKLQELTSK